MSITDELYESLKKWKPFKIDHIQVDKKILDELKDELRYKVGYDLIDQDLRFCGFKIIVNSAVPGYEIIGITNE